MSKEYTPEAEKLREYLEAHFNKRNYTRLSDVAWRLGKLASSKVYENNFNELSEPAGNRMTARKSIANIVDEYNFYLYKLISEGNEEERQKMINVLEAYDD